MMVSASIYLMFTEHLKIDTKYNHEVQCVELLDYIRRRLPFGIVVANTFQARRLNTRMLMF